MDDILREADEVTNSYRGRYTDLRQANGRSNERSTVKPNLFYNLEDARKNCSVAPYLADLTSRMATEIRNLEACKSGLLESLKEMVAMIYEGVPEREWPIIKDKAVAIIAKVEGAK